MTATPTTPTDTRVMPVLHSAFRREFRLAGPLVRDVAPGDTARAEVVAAHLELLGLMLHHHHDIEDRLLWPLLLERVPEELAPIVHLMESQHDHVARIGERLATELPQWRATAAEEVRDRVAAAYDELYVALAEHLDAEEQRLLPIAARAVSQEEWDRMGEEGRDSAPPGHRSLTFGMFAYEGDPEGLALMLADAPPPVRWLVPRLGRRAYRRHALRVHGTATP